MSSSAIPPVGPIVSIIIGIFFLTDIYERFGISRVIDFFQTQFPENTLQFHTYLVNDIAELGGPLSQTDGKDESPLQSFLLLPGERKVIISERTSFLVRITDFLREHDADHLIPCFSLTATTDIVSTLPNTLSWAYSDKFSCMAQVMLYRRYRCRQMHVLYDSDLSDKLFFDSYIRLIRRQCDLLGIPLTVDALVVPHRARYIQHSRTQIILLATNERLQSIWVTPSFLKAIWIADVRWSRGE